MADYAVGDIQGCFAELKHLLELVNFNPSQDHLYCVGDIVARGADSLSALRLIRELGNSATVTLGNHDLHLIACHYLNNSPNPKDNLATLFAAPDFNQLVEFLRQQPLAVWLEQHNSLLCHAGLNPQWSKKQGLKQAKQAKCLYQGADALHYFSNMYQNTPTQWQDADTTMAQFVYTVNSFTRMRFVDETGALDLKEKGQPKDIANLMPWFKHPKRQKDKFATVFGHWAALEGNTEDERFIALDTGCVWGKSLTIMELGKGVKTSVDAFSNEL